VIVLHVFVAATVKLQEFVMKKKQIFHDQNRVASDSIS